MELKKVSDLPLIDNIKPDDLVMVVQNKEGGLTSSRSTAEAMQVFFNKGVVKSVNGEFPDEIGNVSITVGTDGNSGSLPDAPYDNKVYGRGGGDWIAMGDNPNFINKNTIQPLATKIYARSGVLYTIPFVAVGFSFSSNLEVTSDSVASSYIIPPRIITQSNGFKYIQFSSKNVSGDSILTIKDLDNDEYCPITISHSGGVLYAYNTPTATYNANSRTITVKFRFREYEGNKSYIIMKPYFSLVKQTSIPNSMNEVIENGVNVNFSVSYVKDALGQFFSKYDNDTTIIIKVGDNVENGPYVLKIFDSLSAIKFEFYIKVS